ncbi:hypothetical protein ABEB36_003316 [Hypothenemus hampei]|uniref:RING-CH-type domain-containing protein n=1 Tax=Hypothenemus hampei TaxID=57062 RepID=A0ABD1F8Q9_HYPHA
MSFCMLHLYRTFYIIVINLTISIVHSFMHTFKIPSMKQPENAKNKKDVFVTLILTESTSSFLSLDVPHLDHTLPENSRICVITEKDFQTIKSKRNEEQTPGSSSADHRVEIGSTVALFSTSNCSSSSEFNEESSEEINRNQNASVTELFKKEDVIHYPLVSVRSMAHSDKIYIEHNNFYVTRLNSDSQLSCDLMCRICHGGDSIDDLLTPCRCRGTIALVHLKCLERWLLESNHSCCELCNHRYSIIRERQYSVLWSILVFLRHPGLHLKEIIMDLITFSIYTPSAVASTYMLMLICEGLAKNSIVTTGSLSSHIIAFSAVFGMAAIDFTYSSWLITTLQRHVEAWREWYNSHTRIRVILSKIKVKQRKKK